MLNPQAKAAAVLKGPDGRTVSEVVPDARNWRCVVDSIQKRWRSSGQPASWRGSRAVAVAILPTNVGEWAVYLGNVRSIFPEGLEAIGREFGVGHRVLDVLVQ
jgi:hypothetical protein